MQLKMQSFHKQILLVLLLPLFFGASTLTAANNSDTSSIYKHRQRNLIYAEVGSGLAIHSGLYFAWYSQYQMGKFHFIDDSREWLQMDKLGHAYSAYYLGVMANEAGKWAGFSQKHAAMNGLFVGIGFQTLIEVLDGFSSGWGASISDIGANTAGSLLFYTQARTWGEQRFTLKYNFFQSQYASLRPNVLGKGLHQEFLKDYNGQAYWLSFNPLNIIGKQSQYFPDWLNISLGYGASGMLGGFSNNWVSNNTTFDYTHIPRYRQYYLSADINWLKLLKPKKHWSRLLCTALNAVKVPFPTLEYNTFDKRIHGLWLR